MRAPLPEGPLKAWSELSAPEDPVRGFALLGGEGGVDGAGVDEERGAGDLRVFLSRGRVRML